MTEQDSRTSEIAARLARHRGSTFARGAFDPTELELQCGEDVAYLLSLVAKVNVIRDRLLRAEAEADKLRAELVWKAGDEAARSGDLIEAAFGFTHVATNYHYYDYVVVLWDEERGAWTSAEGDIYDASNDELPIWYRKLTPPSSEAK